MTSFATGEGATVEETETDRVPPTMSRVRSRPAAATVSRLVTQWTQTLAELQRSGYRLTSQQRAAMTEILNHEPGKQ